MPTATVYACAPSDANGREALIHAEVQRALTTMAELDRRVVPHRGGAGPAGRPLGPAQIAPWVRVIALGAPAHVALADTSKRTLIACDLDLDGDGDPQEPIEQIIWSSINTVAMVALGRPAWQSIQLLPVARRCVLPVPPLSLDRADAERPSVLVIDHEATAARAVGLAEALDRASFCVRYVGPHAPWAPRGEAWTDTGSIHVHVGDHTLDTEMPRLVDSWQSGRPAVQLARRGSVPPNVPAVALSVDDRQNGFVCATENEVVAICGDLLDDPVLRHKVVGLGRSSAARYHDGWRTVAEALLA